MNQRLALLKHTLWAEVLTFHGSLAPSTDFNKVLQEEGGVKEMTELEKILFSLSVNRHKEAMKIIRQITHKSYETMPESFSEPHEGISEEKLKKAADLQKESDNIFEMMLLMIKMRYPNANISMSDFRRGANNIEKYYEDYLKAPLLEIEETPVN